MKQSRIASWVETFGSTATGFLLSLVIQHAICWWYDLPLRLHDNLAIIGVFTVASLIRSYGWRRLMEAIHVRRPLSPFMQAVIAERYRQVEVEGYDTAHDDSHHSYDLASGGAAYLLDNENYWPWGDGFKRDHPKRRKLVIGAAMALAAGEHLDRNRSKRSAA